MNEQIRARIEQLLGWKEGDSNTFSLKTLLAFVKDKDPKFAKELALYLDKGEHWFVPQKVRR